MAPFSLPVILRRRHHLGFLPVGPFQEWDLPRLLGRSQKPVWSYDMVWHNVTSWYDVMTSHDVTV